jgi:hypothetical protein
MQSVAGRVSSVARFGVFLQKESGIWSIALSRGAARLVCPKNIVSDTVFEYRKNTVLDGVLENLEIIFEPRGLHKHGS